MDCSGAVRVEHFVLRPLVTAPHFRLLLNTQYADPFPGPDGKRGEEKACGM